MSSLRILLAALLVLAPLAASEEDHAHYAPPFAPGPSGGDEFNLMRAGEDGRIVAGRAYPVVSVLSCDAQGGFALYEIVHTAARPDGEVNIDFSQAAVDPYVFVTVNVLDADGTFLGALHQRGPLTGSGQLTVPLTWPDASGFTPRDIRIQFGLEITTACPSADAGTVKFDQVHVGH